MPNAGQARAKVAFSLPNVSQWGPIILSILQMRILMFRDSIDPVRLVLLLFPISEEETKAHRGQVNMPKITAIHWRGSPRHTLEV